MSKQSSQLVPMQDSNGEPSREIQSVLMRHHSEQTINSSDTDTPCPLIHQFPVEILARIFFECLPDPMSVPFDCAQLWNLGRICSRWRSVICLEMPLTWSTIKINFRSSTARAARLSRHSAEIMRVCIQRTRECPLTIAYTCASDVGATARDDWLRCLDSLVAVSERWKSIDFFIPITVLSRLLPAKGRLKSLEVLNLSLEPQNARSLPRAVDIFEDAPKLTRVTMSSHLSLDTFRLPWKQIIEYRTKLMEVWNCVEVLHHAPHLRALHAKLERARGNISGDTASPYPDHLDHKTFSYESLTSLSINGLMRPGYEHELSLRLLQVSSDSDKANVTQILFPSLTNFRLATSSGSLINFAALPLAGSCFGSLLTKVTIRSVFDALADYSGAKDFLLGLPMVRQLTFGVCFHHNRDVVHILYEILSLPSSSDSGRPLVVLPKLEVLVLDIDYDNMDLLMPSWVIDPLKKMIRSRRTKDFVRRCVPLQKFHLYLASWETPRESFAKGLQDLTEEGFEIRVLRGLFAQV
ncbi:hypothetical protein DFJ43DRAFT_1107692 [Lentinula guzmanii]|uniref:F-box domain-containing protein n=1 Tax=Lentinula guzmanii TaxID=2804957 RepID=A0AA38MUJ2_9AGAR|nr:hypothetical protein DFJ43DRAFT_1107692 [Lentinula guzmanii]